MDTVLQLLVRELVLLALLAALGSGVVALLAPGLSGPIRAALAPAAGLAFGATVLTTAPGHADEASGPGRGRH